MYISRVCIYINTQKLINGGRLLRTQEYVSSEKESAQISENHIFCYCCQP